MKIPDFRDPVQRDEVRNDYRKPFARRVEDVNMPYRIDQKKSFTRCGRGAQAGGAGCPEKESAGKAGDGAAVTNRDVYFMSQGRLN